VVRSQDRAVQWQLEVERSTTVVALTDLPRRMFHATSVRADGISFSLRRRIPRPQVTRERLDGLPPIEGFDPVPYAEEGPQDDNPDWRYRIWTVWLQDVEARNLRRVWMDKALFEGSAWVAGGFYLKPIREVVVGPVELR